MKKNQRNTGAPRNSMTKNVIKITLGTIFTLADLALVTYLSFVKQYEGEAFIALATFLICLPLVLAVEGIWDLRERR